jgi:YggT family protein
MDGYLAAPLIFLVSALFDLYILLIMIRFWLQRRRADFYNPISQLIVRLTSPPLKILRRWIPGWGGYDIAAIALMLLLQILSLALILLLRGLPLDGGMLIMQALIALVELSFNLFIFSIIIQAILSWIQQGGYNPLSAILYHLNEPLLRPIRRLIPPISGFDLSVLVAILGLQVVKMLVIPPLDYLASAI